MQIRESLLRLVHREIDPLQHPGDNPVKRYVRVRRKANTTRVRGDISKARMSGQMALRYAKRRGLPNLIQQLKHHLGKMPQAAKKKAQSVAPKKGNHKNFRGVGK